MVWHQPGDKPLSELLMDRSSLHICITRPQWVNSLWPSDAIWRHNLLAQLMACCLMAPSHYLNHCWLLFSQVLWHSPESNFTASDQATVFIMSWGDKKNILLNLVPNLYYRDLWANNQSQMNTFLESFKWYFLMSFRSDLAHIINTWSVQNVFKVW